VVTRAKASQDRADGRAAPGTPPGRASGRPAASRPQTGAWELAWLSGTGPEVLWCHARAARALPGVATGEAPSRPAGGRQRARASSTPRGAR